MERSINRPCTERIAVAPMAEPDRLMDRGMSKRYEAKHSGLARGNECGAVVSVNLPAQSVGA